MKASAFTFVLVAVLGANAAIASDLMLDREAAKRWDAQRAAATSIVSLPGYTRVTLPPVTPAESEQAIWSRSLPPDLNARGAAVAGAEPKALAPSLPPSIVELARALRNDVDLIYEYVRNNIEYYPIWGVQKGALGTLLDNQGAAFDQASLMVALLRQAGHTASFVKGRIALTAADVGAWLGISTADSCAVLQLFGAARIPVAEAFNISGGCSALFSMQIDHVWVKVNIGGTDYYFDPSFKPHALKPGIDLAAVTGYNATTYLNAARTGATVTADYIQNVNRTNLRANLTTYAGNLAAYVRTNLPAGELGDLVGGMNITPYAGPALRQTTLPYQNVSVPVTEYTDIPANYKPTLRVQYAGIDTTFTSDALYGSRLTLTYDGGDHAVLSLEGATVATSPGALTPGTSGSVDFTVMHNAYATTDADQAFTQFITAGGTYLIGNGWGPAGRGPVTFHQTRFDTARAAGAADASEIVLGSSLAVLSSTWIAQTNRAYQIIDRLGGTSSTFHHQIGIAGYDQAAYVDLPGNLVSITSQFSDVASQDAVFFTQGMHGSIFESTAVQQTSGITALSTVKLIDQAVGDNLRIYDASAANYSGTVVPNLVNCAPFLPSFQAAVAAGNRLILPSHCDLNENSWTGTGYFDITAGATSIGSIISGGFAGGFSSQPQSVTQLNGNLAIFVADQPKTPELAGPTLSEPIDLTTGHYLYDHADIATGIGKFPHSLAFHRLYNSGARTVAGPLGKGWTHNFAISAGVSSDGLQAMGEDSALDAVAPIVEFMVALDLLNDVNKPLDKMVVAAVGQRWFSEQLLGNTVMVRQGLNGDVFVKLVDGSYNAPPGNSGKLINNGDGTYTLETLHKARFNFNAAGNVATYVHPGGVQVNFTYSGSDLTQVQNSFGRTLTLTNTGGRITSIGDGVRNVSYTYEAPTGDLTKFTDAAANDTTMQYDLPGRLTGIFYPSNPAVAFITNSYDTLSRVQTQTDANAHVNTYFFAGTRSEEVAPDGSSNVSYVDGLGNVVKFVDPLGRVTLRTHDAQARLTKTVLPEGNSTEFDYDDAPCVAQLRCTHNIKTVRKIAKPASGQPTLTGSFVYESAFNAMASVTDPRGKTTDFTYTAQGDILQVMRPADAGGVRPQTTFTYSSFAPAGFPSFLLPTTVTTLVALGEGVDYTASYNAANHYVPLTTVADAGAGKLNLTTAYTFDSVGNVTQLDGPRSDVTDTTSYAYDAERRVTQKTDALGLQTRQAYDAVGRLTRIAAQVGAQWLVSCRSYTPSGKLLKSWGPGITASDTTCPAAAAPTPVTDLTYDDLDRVLHATQNLPAGEGGNRVTEMVYGLDGRVQSERRAVGTALSQFEAGFTYTANGMLATLTDAKNNRTTYAYDGLDRKVKTSFPDKVLTDTSSATDFEQYGYDENGNLTSLRRRSGQVIAVGYDNLNRLVSLAYPSVADNVNLGYDLFSRPLLASFADSSSSVAFVWDHAGRLTSTTAGGKTLSYLYDPAGNRTRTTWPEATPFYVTTDYDALNRPTAIKELGTTTLAAYTYDDVSRRTAVALGNTTTTSHVYSTQGNLASLAHDLGGAARDVSFAYTRNQAQEITSVAASNALYEWTGAASGSSSFAANGLNQYTSVAGVGQSYDGNGNLSATGTWSYTYDADNRLRTANGPGVAATLGWDAVGRLRQTTIGGATTQLLYDNARLVAEYDGAGTLLRRYVHGPAVDEPVVKYEGAGTGSKSWFYADHLGSIVASANAAGNATATLSYGPFGESGTTSPERYGYTGQQFIGSLNLYHYKARFYSPALGRFLQTDPIGFTGGMNLYNYVGANPVNAIDPSGLDAHVYVNGNNVTIVIPINYSGNGATAATIQANNAAIESRWSGTFGQYQVTTTVVPGHWYDSATNNIVLDNGTGTSFVNKVGGNSGTWYQPGQGNPTWEATHETGHVLGLDDRYADTTVNGSRVTTPNPGFETNLMGAYGQTGIREQDIADVIKANNSWLDNTANAIANWLNTPSPNGTKGK